MPSNGILRKAKFFLRFYGTGQRPTKLPSTSACAFVLWIFFIRGMQVILFHNVVYVYVCKIGEEKFGGW